MANTFNAILDKYRSISFSEHDKGDRFERLMKAYLLTDPKYAHKFEKVWLWAEFPGRNDLGGQDTGIDLVARTNEGDYWAVQCKCYQEDSYIDKPAVDSFLATSSRQFTDEDSKTHSFAHRLWISTTNKWGTNAQEAIKNQNPPLSRINLHDLSDAPLNWQKLDSGITGEVARTGKKELRPHQTAAVNNTHNHFKNNDRGKLIMACGTGKTFTSLRIAEKQTEGKGLILFLVPSIALLGQTLNEWYADAVEPINAICICSDPEITKNRKQLEDIDTSSVIDLAFPASTNVDSILHQFSILGNSSPLGRLGGAGLTVVFSTYQSIEVIAKAQKALEKSNPEYAQFDLIICDEAHRTTGVSLANEDESAFTKVHNDDFIKAKKRLYMTATPRLYNEDTKNKAAQAEALLCSMDDETLYGKEIYKIGFGEAVAQGLLTDYKVLILTLSENDVPPAVQKALSTAEGNISTDDPSKLIGCINALAKQILGDEGIIKETDPQPMQRAVAFCQNIAVSKSITNTFGIVSEKYIAELPAEKQKMMQTVASKHIDGTMNATQRNELLTWLKAETAPNECKILTNVRCLSEGVDVPSLDAVMFLSPRNSQVEVVQSVGRVMRKSPGKKYGYIIIPIVVPADVQAHLALDTNKEYKVVWDVLNALRAHDDRFDATVNQIELNRNKPERIIVGGAEYGFDGEGNPIKKTDGDGSTSQAEIARQLALQFQQLQSVVFGKLVQKVGNKRYWEQWAKSVADIATRQTERITKLIGESPKYQTAFYKFLSGLHKNINPSITQTEAIEMLSQHIITKPVFDALFENYSFVANNPMSQSMQKMLDLLEDQSIDKDAQTLDKFYESVKMRASGIDNAEAKQRIIIELYDKFFKTAFPKMVEKLGIVYSPVEVVDFIIHSVADILQKEFGRNISDENVHILDPFTGTGTFITRLLQSGLIHPKDLARKYTCEIHCNEIVLLAYYIAAVNIENAYHDAQTGNQGTGFGVKKGTGFGVQGTESNNFNNHIKNEFIQRADGLAGSDEPGGDGIFGNKAVSEGGDVWANKPNEESSGINTSQHSGGLREELKEGIPPFLGDNQRLTDGTGNPYIDSQQNKLYDSRRTEQNNSSGSNSKQNINRITKITATTNLGDGQGTADLTPNPVPQTPEIPYLPFEGICLTDTFQLGESPDGDKLYSDMFPQNSQRVQRQQKAPLQIIFGNPPYSIGQKSANDNAQNQSYPKLDAKIASTYAKQSSAGLNKSLYDAYIKAFRWSTDRLGKTGGIIAFVSNGAWLDGNSTDGFRKTLEKEFDSIYVFNLRGNQRTSGELSRKEGGKIFGSGSRTPIAITLLVKNPTTKFPSSQGSGVGKATIHYHDIGDYLDQKEKLKIISDFKTFANPKLPLTELKPNEHGDWISVRNDAFENFIPLAPEKKFDAKTQSFFVCQGPGVLSSRDSWVYNFSSLQMEEQMKRMISFYNNQVELFKELSSKKTDINVDDLIDSNPVNISWTRSLKSSFKNAAKFSFQSDFVRKGVYRPYCKQVLYYEKNFIESPGLNQKFFPENNSLNNIISIPGVGGTKDFTVLLSNEVTDYQVQFNNQCFPLYYYEEKNAAQKGMFDEVSAGSTSSSDFIRRDAISDFILEQARKQYGLKKGTGSGVQGTVDLTPNPLPKTLETPKTLEKEDIFYYVYGFLHSATYRETFANDLKKMLPRLPLVEDAHDFWKFSKAGRQLAELHLNYETLAPFAGVNVTGDDGKFYTVEKMRFPKKDQKDTIVYNSKITISNIPAQAYEYVVNGKSAIEWIMERYQITTHKESGITNNPNDWASETGKPRYILDLLLSIINVSVQTVDIVNSLPAVRFEPQTE